MSQAAAWFFLLLLLFAAGRAGAREVVVYTALDRQFSEPILADFETSTGIRVRAVYDTEAVKTVGLVNRLLAERARPRCDVFWNNEILRSLQLKKEGLTAPYTSPSARRIPAELKDPEGHWTGFAARARVILVNTRLLPDRATWPTRVADAALPAWKGRVAVARPLFGTTNTHAAVIWSTAGAAEAQAYWDGVFAHALLVPGNAQSRDAAAAGEVAWALTDTDDAQGAIEDGAPVAIVYPSHDVATSGTLVIPNTVALMKNSPNPVEARALIDYLLSEAVEVRLSQSRSAQIPVRAGLPAPKGIPPLPPQGIMAVDWDAAYRALAPSTEHLAGKLRSR